MRRLIDADALKYEPLPKGDRNYRTYNLDDAYDDGYDDAFTDIRNAPTIEAIPVSYIRETINKNEELYEYAIKKCAFGVANTCNNYANALEILLIDWSEQNEKTD